MAAEGIDDVDAQFSAVLPGLLFGASLSHLSEHLYYLLYIFPLKPSEPETTLALPRELK